MPVKITDLTASTTITSNDLIQIIDSDDITFSPIGTNKKITAGNAANQLANLITSVPPIVVSALSTKANLSSPTFSGNVSLPDTTAIGPVNGAEIGRLSGVTSGIQGQLDLKAPLASPAFTGTVTLPTGTVTSDMILNDTIVNADINASAAIAGTKIAPNFGSQNIVTTGNVGIGTSSPTERLSVVSDAATITRFSGPAAPTVAALDQGIAIQATQSSSTVEKRGFIDFRNENDIAVTSINSAHFPDGSCDLAISATNVGSRTVGRRAEIVRIKGNGNVGIGTNSPNARLDVASNSTPYDVAIAVIESTHATSNRAAILLGSWNIGQDLNGDGGRNYYIYDDRARMEISSSVSSDPDNVRFRNVNNGAQYWYYNKSNHSGVVSDERTKNTIQKLDTAEALQYINRISPSTFISNGDTELQAGFIAQDLLENATTPDQKTTINNHKTYHKDDPDCPILGVADRPLVAYLVAAMQEQQKIIDTLQTRLDALEK